ncbi:MAG: NAD(+) synthase [Peptococcaceae bacterium]|nr:NAD(+) synthase [Peptococcaceae bacterium]
MDYGFVKVAAATPEIKVADCVYNTESVLKLWLQAEEQGCQLVVFPELVLTGATCGDLFTHPVLLNGCMNGLKKLIDASADLQSVAVVGMPFMQHGKVFNCAVVIQQGEVLGVVPKTVLSESDRRVFSAPADTVMKYCDALESIYTDVVPFGTKQLFISNGQQAFSFAVEVGEDLYAPVQPSTGHAMAGASVIVNLSAGNELIGSAEYRRQMVSAQSGRLLCGYVYASAGYGESTTDLVFAGHNLIAENGTVLAESKLFDTGLIITELDVEKLEQERRKQNFFPQQIGEGNGYYHFYFEQNCKHAPLTRTIDPMPFIPSDSVKRAERCELILSIQAQGLKKRLVHSWAKSAVIGISGGLDSTLALLVAAKAMDLLNRPRTDIVAVTMPCFGTTSRTRSNAELLCQELGVTFRTVDIGNTVKAHFADIGHDFEDHSITFENGQARERTQVLMDIANQTNGLVIGTGDLSELALGWATYNGDHMSMYGVNGSIPKTLVRHVVRYVADTTDNAKLSETLLDILDTPVSPELLPAQDGEIAQKTEDLVGPYELHDFFLYHAVRWACPPKKIYYLAQKAFAGQYDNETILHWLRTFFRRFFNQQFKRSCLPDGPKVGTVGLSPRGDWNMPSDAMSTLWLAEIDELKA